MKISDFRQLCRTGVIYLPSSNEANSQNSKTDPTQACPVQKVYNALVNGQPLDIAERANVYNSLKVDNLSSIEKRHTDKFDVFNEAHTIGKSFSKVAKMQVDPADKK